MSDYLALLAALRLAEALQLVARAETQEERLEAVVALLEAVEVIGAAKPNDTSQLDTSPFDLGSNSSRSKAPRIFTANF